MSPHAFVFVFARARNSESDDVSEFAGMHGDKRLER